MIEIIRKIISGKQYSKCGNEILYTLKDGRF